MGDRSGGGEGTEQGGEVINVRDDDHLLQRMRLQDVPAMAAFYQRHARAVHAFAYHRLHDAALADEVVNDTMHQSWLSAHTFAGNSSVKTWLLGIAKNKILDAARKRSRHQSREQTGPDDVYEAFADTAPGAYLQLLSRQRGQHLSQCFEKLPAEQSACMHLFLVEGMTLAEIAQVMTIPANTVATRIHHAKRKLRACMECIFGKGEVL
jgi:RNA polymerase sigma-70 factor, ECF subfamily